MRDLHASDHVAAASTDAFDESYDVEPFAVEFGLGVEESRCFVGDLAIDEKKCEELLRVGRFEQQEAIVMLRQRVQVQELAGFIGKGGDRLVIEKMAVDLIADFQGKRGKVWGHFSSAVWTVSAAFFILCLFCTDTYAVYLLEDCSVEKCKSW